MLDNINKRKMFFLNDAAHTIRSAALFPGVILKACCHVFKLAFEELFLQEKKKK